MFNSKLKSWLQTAWDWLLPAGNLALGQFTNLTSVLVNYKIDLGEQTG